MTAMTLAQYGTGDSHDPEHARGRADAYDEHQAGEPLHILEARFDQMADPLEAHTVDQLVPRAYLDGYLAYLEDARATQHFETHTQFQNAPA
ncbi:hypothetical protein AB0D12_32025 [Streptomyces sp. NPDC048479]|uniref:hypothetical protein n=1 Tax=Streptomyces sp. NPDC048479 TaxID=3154725 RepID=UPI00342A1606